jgi:hypothetical protein
VKASSVWRLTRTELILTLIAISIAIAFGVLNTVHSTASSEPLHVFQKTVDRIDTVTFHVRNLNGSYADSSTVIHTVTRDPAAMK